MTSLARRVGVLTATAALAATTVAAAAPTFAGTAAATTANSSAKHYVYKANGYTTDPAAAKLIAQAKKQLPANFLENRAKLVARTGIEAGPVTQAVLNRLNGAPCQPTALDAYIDRIMAGIPFDRLFFLAFLGAFDYPTYDALFYGDRSNPDYALEPGTVPKVRKAVKAARAVWDIPSGNIVTMGMSSEMVVDQARVTRAIQLIFGAPKPDAAELAKEIIALILDTKQLRGGYNPIFTLNAFAFDGADEGLPELGKRIVMGDGIIKALRDTGNIEVGPQMVVSHEYGHQVQYAIGTFDGVEPSPEATRRTEMMADAYGAYLDAHNKGLNFNASRINGAVALAHLVGDCSVDSLSHHGTPDQRARAARWGADLALKDGNNVIPSRELQAKFDAALPGLLAG